VIPQQDLQRQHAALREELLGAAARVFGSSRFVLGEEGRALEAEVAQLCGTRHAIGVGSGTDALRLALAALEIGPGDEVVTTAFSFIASASTILMAGATPVFADIEADTFAIDPAEVERLLGPRTRAVVPVHLYGHPAALDRLTALARGRGLAVIEDAAQAIGATYAGRPVGSWGDLACLSFYPTKNLGACGDAGMILTSRDDLALRLRELRDHGSAERYPTWNPVLFQPKAGVTQYITDDRGRTLYSFSNDKFKKNNFTKAALTNNAVWPIDTLGGIKSVPSLLDKSKFDTVMLFGKVQLSYNGWPLYYFGSDSLKRGNNKGVSVPTPGFWPYVNAGTKVAPQP